jgi:uncharacterized damage-inducible protein DinB
MTAQAGPRRAAQLVADLERAASALISVLQAIEPERWTQLPAPGVWSVGKEAEHVAGAALHHQEIVRLSVGQRAASRLPAIERREPRTTLTVDQAVALIRERTQEGAALISSLTDEQLTLPTRPPRARGETLAGTIERVLIRHYDAHRREIERKLRMGAPGS